MSLFYLIFGCLLGVVFSVTMISGVAWCVQTTVRGGARAGVAAGAAIALAQVFWAGLAAAAVMMLLGRFWQLDWMCRLLSALVLTHFAWQVIQAGPIKTLTYEGPAKRNAAVFGDTLLAAP
jgi:threonine/homoserine/homoserine lactone efflux protein